MSWREADKTPVLGRLFSEHLEKRLGPTRPADAPVEQKHKDMAATLQARLEEVLFENLNALHARTKQKSLCIAGGVAFNCVANGKIFDRTPFERVFVQPAAGDAGLAIGAAYYVHHQVLGRPRGFVMKHSYWGPGYSPAADPRGDRAQRPGRQRRGNLGACRRKKSRAPRPSASPTETSSAGSQDAPSGARARWGTAASWPTRGAPEMKEILNRRIKHREMFRPFAPSILAECTGEFFEQSHPSPFMTFAYSVRPEKRDSLAAPTHVDGTARLQTVEREANPRYWRLIREFGNLTGVPAVVNTSFNDNEPIVCRPEEAIDCFLRTRMDALVLGDFLICRPASAEAPSGSSVGSQAAVSR